MEIFIIQNFGFKTSDKGLNAIMDNNHNIICWKKYDDANKYIKLNLDENHFRIVKIDYDFYKNYLEYMSSYHKHKYEIRLIDTVEFN